MLTAPTSLIDLMRSGPRRAPVTMAFLATNAAVFLLMLLAGAGWWHTPNGVQLAWGANFGPATQDGQWWRLFTAMFIHFGVIHLALNMWALWDVGRLVEQIYGRWRFALLYLGSGVVGNLVSLVMQGNLAVSGGASGAVFSLYGALLVFLWRERRQVDPGEFRWLFGGALAFSALMLIMGHMVQGIDNSAHAGGLLAGMLLGALLAVPWTSKSPLVLRTNVAGLLLLLVVLTLLITRLPPPTYLLGDELRARAAIEAFLVQDQSASKTLDRLLRQSANDPRTFDALAGRIETDVSAVYAKSFEQLQQTTPGSAVPSAAMLQNLRDYADRRAEATHELAQSIRTGDVDRACRALQRNRQAPMRGASATDSVMLHTSKNECAGALR
jgi:rhomboid protease GluP